MKPQVSAFILFITLMSYSFGQNHHGFYGKKNFLEVTSVSYVPMLKKVIEYYQDGAYLNGDFAGGYKVSDDSTLVKRSTDLFNTGIRIKIGRAFRKRVGLSIESGFDYWSTPVNFQYLGDYKFERHENLKMSTFHLMPKLHIASKVGLLPMGLNHEFGIGFTRTKVREKEYLNEGFFNSFVKNQNYLDFNRAYRGIQLLYGLEMRKPISKSLLINYGIRYTVDFNIGMKSSDPIQPYLKSIYDESSQDIRRLVFINNITNVLSFDLGITYAF